MSNQLKIKLLNLSKEDLVTQILELLNKKQSQAKKINELTEVISKYKNEVANLYDEIVVIKDESKNKKNIKYYEDLLRDYRIEISDLKDEIEDWKKRYVLKGK